MSKSYYRKKQGITVEYPDYKGKSRKGKILVNVKGTIYKKNINKLISDIKNSDMSSTEQEAYISQLIHTVEKRAEEYKRKNIPMYNPITGRKNNGLTVTGFMGHMEQTKLDRFFRNFGSSVEEFANTYGFTLDEVYANKDNFNGDEMTINGRTFRFRYDYSGPFAYETTVVKGLFD